MQAFCSYQLNSPCTVVQSYRDYLDEALKQNFPDLTQYLQEASSSHAHTLQTPAEYQNGPIVPKQEEST